MPRVPVITSPCPLNFKTAPRAGLDFCGRCQKRVHNLDGLSDAQRDELVGACSGEICVSYTVRRPRVGRSLLGVGFAAASALASSPAAAYNVVESYVPNAEWAEHPEPVDSPEAVSPDTDAASCPFPYREGGGYEFVVSVGGVATSALRWVDQAEAAAPRKPDLPEIEAEAWLPSPESSDKR